MIIECESLAVVLAERFGLRPRLLLCAVAFQRAVSEALKVVSEDVLLDWVLDGGGLSGSHNPYAVLISRIRQVPEHLAADLSMLDSATEARRWGRVDAAVRRAETLRTLVARGEVFPDEAAALLVTEITDEDIRAVALAALGGGAP